MTLITWRRQHTQRNWITKKNVIYSQLSYQLIFALWFKLKGLAIAQNVLRETEEQDLVSRRQELCIACASMCVCLLEFVLRIYKVDLDSDAISEHLLFKFTRAGASPGHVLIVYLGSSISKTLPTPAPQYAYLSHLLWNTCIFVISIWAIWWNVCRQKSVQVCWLNIMCQYMSVCYWGVCMCMCMCMGICVCVCVFSPCFRQSLERQVRVPHGDQCLQSERKRFHIHGMLTIMRWYNYFSI